MPEPEAGAAVASSNGSDAAVESADGEVVEEISVTEEVTLPADGALLDVVELDEDDEDEEPEPSPYDRPAAGSWCTRTRATRTR